MLCFLVLLPEQVGGGFAQIAEKRSRGALKRHWRCSEEWEGFVKGFRARIDGVGVTARGFPNEMFGNREIYVVLEWSGLELSLVANGGLRQNKRLSSIEVRRRRQTAKKYIFEI